MKNLISDTIRQSLAETLPQRCFDTFSGFSLKSAVISPLISQTKAADFQISKGHQLLKNIDLHHPKQSNQKPLESDRTQTCTKTSHKTTRTHFNGKKARDFRNIPSTDLEASRPAKCEADTIKRSEPLLTRICQPSTTLLADTISRQNHTYLSTQNTLYISNI